MQLAFAISLLMNVVLVWMFFGLKIGAKTKALKAENQALRHQINLTTQQSSDLVYGELEKIVRSRQRFAQDVSIERIRTIRNAGPGKKLEYYDLVQIYSLQKSGDGLRREIYVSIYPEACKISLMIDGEDIFREQDYFSVLKDVLTLVDSKVKRMGFSGVGAPV